MFSDRVPPPIGSWLRRFLTFAGPAYLVSVGHMGLSPLWMVFSLDPDRSLTV